MKREGMAYPRKRSKSADEYNHWWEYRSVNLDLEGQGMPEGTPVLSAVEEYLWSTAVTVGTK